MNIAIKSLRRERDRLAKRLAVVDKCIEDLDKIYKPKSCPLKIFTKVMRYGVEENDYNCGMTGEICDPSNGNCAGLRKAARKDGRFDRRKLIDFDDE